MFGAGVGVALWLPTADTTHTTMVVAFGALGCLTAVLFSDNPEPTNRLVKIINAMRGHRTHD